MTVSTFWLWVIPAVVAAGLVLWIAWVYLAERRQHRGGHGRVPADRWLTGGLFRGDPRAVSSREEIPGPEQLPSARESAGAGELPPRPADRGERRD